METQETVGMPMSVSTVTAIEADWPTPGLELSREIAALPEVRLIAERFETNRYSVYVILDRDPEGVLDCIYAAESGLYHRLPRLPFDVRVMTPPPGWDEAALKRDALVRYERTLDR